MNRPIRTTIVFSLACGRLAVPITMLLSSWLYWPTALKLTVWGALAVYGFLMVRWSGAKVLAVLFPLAILLGGALWPHNTHNGFFILALGIFSWIRSGICFTGMPLRRLLAELVTVLGGTGLLLLIGSHTYGAWALNLCLFFLVQALYFFMVPMRTHQHDRPVSMDPFEQAVEEVEKVLGGI